MTSNLPHAIKQALTTAQYAVLVEALSKIHPDHDHLNTYAVLSKALVALLASHATKIDIINELNRQNDELRRIARSMTVDPTIKPPDEVWMVVIEDAENAHIALYGGEASARAYAVKMPGRVVVERMGVAR